MRILSVWLVVALAFGLAGCSWMGKTAGMTKAAVEDGVDDLERGYHQGYGQEKDTPRKNTGAQTTDAPRSDPDVPAEGTSL